MNDAQVVLLLDSLLLALAVIVAIGVIQTRSLVAMAMLAGMYSLIMALVWVNMGSMDVAFTEAAVGAGISTILLLGAVVFVGREEKQSSKYSLFAIVLTVLTGAGLIYGTFDMPAFGDPNAPLQTLRAPKFISQSVRKAEDYYHEPIQYDEAHCPRVDDFDCHAPNMVTSLLASYRSFDTMFEAAVIFTAGAALILLLRRERKKGAP